MLNYLVVVFVCYVLVYLCGYRVFIVIYLVPSCVTCYFLDADQIMEEMLRIDSNLLAGVCYWMIVLDIERRDL